MGIYELFYAYICHLHAIPPTEILRFWILNLTFRLQINMLQ